MSYPDGRVPEGLHLRAELAEAEPVVSRDGKTYTFTVRKDARFSDGKPVTARAFARALERILTPAMESPSAPDFSDIVGAKKMLDGKATTLAGAVAKGRTLTLRLTRRAPDFPSVRPACAPCLRPCPSIRRECRRPCTARRPTTPPSTCR